VSEFHDEALQATFPRLINVAARAGFEPAALRTKDTESTSKPPRATEPIQPGSWVDSRPEGRGTFSFVIQRNPCIKFNDNNRKKYCKDTIQIKTRNVRAILRPGELAKVKKR